MGPGLKFGPFELRPEEKLLLREGEIVILAPKTLALLTVLAQAAGNVVTRSELLRQVWPDSFIEEGNLSQHVFVLRKLLSPSFPDTPPILTIPKLGYRFNLPVEAVADTFAAAPPSEPGEASQSWSEPPAALGELPHPAPARAHFVRPWALVLGSAIALGVVALTAYLGVVRLRKPNIPRASGATGMQIAVLPYENLSGRVDDRWISTAVSEMVSTDLSIAPGVGVVPMESVVEGQRETGIQHASALSPEQARSFARDVHCDVLITGAFLVNGGQLRLDTHWVSGRTGAALGSATQTSAMDEILPLIADTADRVHRELQLPDLAAPDAAAMFVVANPAAYRLYREAEERRSQWDAKSAIELYRQAAVLDPKSPMIPIGMAGAYSVLGREALAVEEASRAETLAARLPREQALQVTAAAETIRQQPRKAADAYRTLLALRPGSVEYRRQLIGALSGSGQIAEAQTAISDAQKQLGNQDEDPRFDSTVSDHYSLVGDWARSLAWAEKGIAEAKRRGSLIIYGRLLTTASQAHLHLKQYAEATSETQEALAMAKRFDDYSGELRALNRLGQIDVATGDLRQAEQVLNEALHLEQALGESQRKIHTLGALGDLAQKGGHSREALALYQEQLALATNFGYPDYIALAKLNVANAELQLGDRKAAEAGMRAVLALSRTVGDHDTESRAKKALAGLRQ